MAGVTGGIGGALVPGVAGAAGKGAATAVGQGAGQGAAAAAGQAAPKMAADAIAQQTAQASATEALTQKALQESTKKGLASMIDPKKAVETGLKLASSSGGQQQPAPQVGPLPMNPGGNQPVSSSDALANLQMAEAPEPSVEPRSAGIEPVRVAALDEDKRIPLQQIQSVRTLAKGGLTSLAQDEMMRRGMDRLPNLGDREQAYMMAQREFVRGGYVEGPGTGTSDDIDAKIYQDGVPVQEAALSDGEFVMTERAVRGAGNGDRNKGAAKMYEMMRQFEGAA